MANDSWGARVFSFLEETEGFREKVYTDVNGHETIGIGHKVLPGEDWSGGITREGARRLLARDYTKGHTIARDTEGHEVFDSLGDREQAILGLSAWNPGYGTQPDLVAAALAGDRDAQLAEHVIHAGGRDLDIRNDAWKDLFFPEQEGVGDVELETAPPKTQIVLKKPPTLKTFTDSEEFQLMNESDQVDALAERDGRFKQLLEEDPGAARRFALAAANAGRGVEGFTATMASSLEGGLERGIGYTMLPIVGAISLLERSGLIDDTSTDDDLLAWVHQRRIEGEKRIGTAWEHQLAGLFTSIGGAAIPGIALLGVTAPAGVAAGLSGIPLWMAAEGAAFGGAGFLGAYGETGDLDEAMQRGMIDGALGMFGGASSAVGRLARIPLDAAAATAAGVAMGLPWQENVIQAGAMTLLAGIPGARITPARRKKLGMGPDTMPNAREVEHQSDFEAAARLRSQKAMERPLAEPIVSRDGEEYHTVVEALRADGKASRELPETYWNPMDHTDEMNAKWENRLEHSAQDGRPLDFVTSGKPDAEIPNGWNPGWRHVKQVPYGAAPDRVTSQAGKDIVRPGEIIGRFAKLFGFNVTRGNVRTGEGADSALGWHWAYKREMKVLRQDDLQTVAHEWGHDIVVTEDALSRYVQGKQVGKDVGRLRGWLQAEEAKLGNTFDEQGVPSATLFKHKDNVPDDLKYLEELVAMSYDRPNLREGFSEFVRIYMTNNKKYGGEVDLTIATGEKRTSPVLNKIFEDWMDTLPKAKKEGLIKFAEDSHVYVRQDATTSMLARFGQDGSPEMVMQSAISKMRQAAIDTNEGGWNAVARTAGPKEADAFAAYAQAAQAAHRLTDLAAGTSVPRLIMDTDGNPVQHAGTGESLRDIIRDIGSSTEMQNAQGAYTAARRQRELYDQVDVAGKTEHVPEFVEKKLAEAKKRLDEGGSREADIKLVEAHNTMPRGEFENAVLRRHGLERRERTDLHLIEENLKLTDNPLYKHLEGTHQRLKNWQRQVRAYGQAAGLINQKQANHMDVFNSEYVFPFKRDMSDAIGGGQGAAPSGGMVSHLGGSEKNFAKDWLELTVEGADEIFRQAEANLAKKFLVDAIFKSPDAGLWFHMYEYANQSRSLPHEGIARVVGNVKKGPEHKITVFRDGDPFHYAPKDEGLLQSMDFLHPSSRGVGMQIVNRIRVLNQDMTTLNPAFFIPALPRDLVASFIFSKTKGNFMMKAIKGGWHAWKNSPEYQNYVAAVGTTASLTQVKPTNAKSLLADAKRADSRVRQIIHTPGALIDTLRKITNTIEASTRMGEYLAATKQGMPAKHAAWLGTQIQPNFASRGTNQLIRGAMDSVNFLGATANSTDRLMRGLFRDTEGKARLIQKLGGMVLASIALDEINRRVIDKYSEIPLWLRQAYHIIPFPEIKDGKMTIGMKLWPKNHELGLVQNAASRVLDEMYADTRKGVAAAGADVIAILLGGVGVNAAGDSFPIPIPAFIEGAAEVKFDTNFFTGNSVVPMEAANNSAYNQVTVDTPQLYKDWGKLTQNTPWLPDFIESPAQIKHLIETFTSHFGTQVALLYDWTFNPNRVAGGPGSGPIGRRFNLPKNKYSTVNRDFYEQAAELRKHSEDMGSFKDRREWDRLRAAQNDPEMMHAIQKSKVFERTKRAAARVEKLRTNLRLDDSLTPEQRYEKDQELILIKRNMLRQTLEQWGPE